MGPATLACRPPLAPMLAALARELPAGDYLYEPKWDGMRCLAFVERGEVDLRSRHGRPLARYFPEIVEALQALPCVPLALDGELLIPAAGGFDFGALLGRVHPSPTRVNRLRRETPASFVAFDLLAEGDHDLCALPFAERRRRVEALGLHDGEALRHVGVCGSFGAQRRRELLRELARLVVPLRGHPWERGFGVGRSPMGRLPGSAGRWDPAEMAQDWIPLAPVRVCEVGFDQLDGLRFRHPARFVRWRPDREPQSCAFDQLAGPGDDPTVVLGL